VPTRPEFPPRFPVNFYATDVAFNADGSLLYAVGEGEVLAFSPGGEKISFPVKRRVSGLAASPTSPTVAYTTDRTIELTGAGGKRLRSEPLTKGVDVAEGVAFSPDGSLFAVGTGHLNSAKTTVEIFSADGKRKRVIADDRGFGIGQVCFTADGKYVVTVRDGQLERWPVGGGAPRRTRVIPRLYADKSLRAARGLIVVGDRGGVVALDERGRVLWGKEGDVDRVAVAPDASLVAAGKGRALTVYSAKGKVLKTIARKSTHEVRALALSADGWLAVGTDGGVELYRVAGAAPAKAPAEPASAKGKAKAPPLAKGKQSVASSWARIDAWLKAHAPPKGDSSDIAPSSGASKKALADLARQLKLKLPADLAESLSIHDGAERLIGGWDLLGTKSIAREAALMRKLVEDGSFGDAQGDEHPRIKSAWWNVGWIPIVSSGSGHLFCVDTDPAPGGKAGQVILFFHDDGKRLRVADSVGAWLAAIAADLEADKYDYDVESETWSDEALLQSSLEGQDTYG
jgi:cell wall assembly regulator SMI1